MNNARLFSPNQYLGPNTGHNQQCRIHLIRRYYKACTGTALKTRNCSCGPCRRGIERRALESRRNQNQAASPLIMYMRHVPYHQSIVLSRLDASFKLLHFKLCTKLIRIFELFVTVNFAVLLGLFGIRAGLFHFEIKNNQFVHTTKVQFPVIRDSTTFWQPCANLSRSQTLDNAESYAMLG
jgi:hypothetical protein